MNAFKLESERLVLMPLSLNHLSQEYVDWMNDPLVNKYLESGGDYTFEKLKLFLEENEKKNILFWAIHLKSSNKHIGNIKIDPVNLITKSGEYGILMGDKTNWSKGYAKEASLRIISYCFNELSLNKITLGVVEHNENAVFLYKKIGFKVDKVVKGTKIYDTKISNLLRMSLNV